MILLWLACSVGFPDPVKDLMTDLDRDGSGGISAAEIGGETPQRVIETYDSDGNGTLEVEELRAALSPSGASLGGPGASKSGTGDAAPERGKRSKPSRR